MIDLHCDTALKLYAADSYELLSNKNQVDLRKLARGKAFGQFFAFFINKYDVPRGMSPFDYYKEIMTHFKRCLDRNSNVISLATSGKDLVDNRFYNKLSAFLTIEGGEAIEKDIRHVTDVYEDGVRLITLTWNYPNHIGYPNMSKNYRHKGLTDFGFDVVDKMQQLGMLVDVSHLSDQGFYDVASRVTGPFVASHSNARAVKNHPRNLTDDMIKVIANKGGIIGINYYAPFVSNQHVSTVNNIVKHIKHIYNTGGIDVLALGSDFDGIDENLEMKDISMVGMLFDALEKEGFSSAEREKIGFRNTLRVIHQELL